MTDEPGKSAIRAWARLTLASQSVLAAVERDLKRAGFPPLSWYDALLELAREPAGRLRPYELEERMLLAQYRMSRLIDRLTKAGYVERLPCEEDGRGQVVAITVAGRSTLRDMWPAYARAIEDRFAGQFSEAEHDVLASLLGRLIPSKQGVGRR